MLIFNLLLLFNYFGYHELLYFLSHLLDYNKILLEAMLVTENEHDMHEQNASDL